MMIFSTYIRFLNISISLNDIKVLNVIFSRHELKKQVNKGRLSLIWKIKKGIWLLITGLISPKLSTYKDKKLQNHNIAFRTYIIRIRTQYSLNTSHLRNQVQYSVNPRCNKHSHRKKKIKYLKKSIKVISSLTTLCSEAQQCKACSKHKNREFYYLRAGCL